MRYRITVSVWTVALSVLAITFPVRAGGYEFPGDDTRALGRGGAFAARVDDPTAVFVNPAALASAPGFQLWISAGLLFADDCFDRNQPGVGSDGETPTAPAWDQGWGTDTSGSRIPYSKVCNQKSRRFTALPSLGLSWHREFEKPNGRGFHNLGVGFLFSPANSERAQRWGDRSYTPTGQSNEYRGYVDAPPGSQGTDAMDPFVPLDNGQRLLPASSRFMLVERHVDVYYWALAVGYKPVKQFQFGIAGGCGFAILDFTYNFRNETPGEGPDGSEGQATFAGRERCAPRLVGSVHIIPHARFDIVGVVRWDRPIKAKGSIAGQPEFAPDDPVQGGGTLTMPRPLWVTAGIRYAHRIDGVKRAEDPDAQGRESGRVEDAMANEDFDIELNVVYERNRVVDSFDLDIDDFERIEIGHNWQDQLSVRLGGDVNSVPGAFAWRWGLSYETSGFTSIRVKARKSSKGGTIDFMPGQRFGVHLGLTGRFSRCSGRLTAKCLRRSELQVKRAELSAAFAYFWMTTHNNDNGGTQQIVVDDNAQISGATVNNGGFSSRYIVASLAFRYVWDLKKGPKHTNASERSRGQR